MEAAKPELLGASVDDDIIIKSWAMSMLPHDTGRRSHAGPSVSGQSRRHLSSFLRFILPPASRHSKGWDFPKGTKASHSNVLTLGYDEVSTACSGSLSLISFPEESFGIEMSPPSVKVIVKEVAGARRCQR